jgi:hypothetical protein
MFSWNAFIITKQRVASCSVTKTFRKINFPSHDRVCDYRVRHFSPVVINCKQVNNLSFWKFEFSQERRQKYTMLYFKKIFVSFLLLTSIFILHLLWRISILPDYFHDYFVIIHDWNFLVSHSRNVVAVIIPLQIIQMCSRQSTQLGRFRSFI